MRHRIIKKQHTSLAMVAVLLGACAGQKKTAYNFPRNMKADIMAAYTIQCDKGKALYTANCARCHNKTVNGRTMIPDFSQEKLIGYELRASNPRHESNLPDSAINAEELGQIMTFLTYKKMNK